MMTTMRKRITGSLLSLMIAVAVSACEAPTNVSDYRQNFPIDVIEETVSLAIVAPQGGELLGPAERYMFSQFIREYQLRSSSPVGISVNKESLGEIVAIIHAEALRTLLRSAGIRRSDIVVLPGGTEAGVTAVLSYTANVVVVPECGDWSSSSSYNWSNTQHSNFGCATQRNLGLMLADPGDLKGTGGMSSFDGDRGAVIIRSYRAGAAAEATAE